MAELVNRSEL